MHLMMPLLKEKRTQQKGQQELLFFPFLKATFCSGWDFGLKMYFPYAITF